MKEMQIRFRSWDEVSQFVQLMNRYQAKGELHSSNYLIDACSILGIFSLDLTKPLNLRLYSPSSELVKSISGYKVA